jgi:transcriptional regulator with XRE-family HTH domain
MAALCIMAAMQHTTGMDLKLRRTAARVTQGQIAEFMGVRKQFISQLEARAVVRPATVERYEAALAAVATSDAA